MKKITIQTNFSVFSTNSVEEAAVELSRLLEENKASAQGRWINLWAPSFSAYQAVIRGAACEEQALSRTESRYGGFQTRLR